MPEFRDELQAALAGRYTLEREISSGVFAVVYEATDLRHSRTVAIKALRPEHLGAVEGERFLREIRLVARLQHPHILPLFDSGEAAGALFYVMPFVEGATLRERMRDGAGLTIAKAVELTREVCDALVYAHQHDVLHRDIKPENILISAGHALVGDFGIARALHAATSGLSTGSGMVRGTLHYMSPEQASDERELTGRSDVYSLGCVLYEMLAGAIPHASSSNQSMLVARMTVPPRDLLAARPDLPPALAAAAMRALATVPANRYADAAQFSEALAVAMATGPSPAARRRRRVAVVAAVALGAAVAAWQILTPGEGVRLDPDMYVVLPFADEGGAGMATDDLRGAGTARLVTDAISRWRGVRLADDMRVRDAIARHGGKAFLLKDALSAAKSLGAGRLVWGVVGSTDAGTDIRLSVFDAGEPSQNPVARARRVLGFGAVVVDSIAAMTDEAMTRVAGGSVDAVPPGTRDAGALRAYLRAHGQLTNFNIDSASVLFARATEQDSAFARAFYWQAQTLAWRSGVGGESWESPAARAVALGPSLSPRERELSGALLALARGEFGAACARYESLIARDSLDFEAWFGKGECLTRDRLVVPDAASPSRWRFRSSAHSAVNAYVRSLKLAPSFMAGVAVSRLEGLLLATANDITTGSIASDSRQFAAYAGLEADTLSRIPWPAEDLFGGKPGTRPKSYVAALDRNRDTLRSVTAQWVRQNPRVAAAHAHLAAALENLAKIDTIGRAESALGEILAARALPHGHADSIRYMATQMRLLVKLSQAGAATSLADSMLRLGGRAAASEAKLLASAAMLTGRLQLATQLLRSAAREEVIWTTRGRFPFPVSVADPGLELAVYAASGAPAARVLPMIERTEQAIGALARADMAPSLRIMLLHMPAALAYPMTGLTPTHRLHADESRYLGIQFALSLGKSDQVRARLDTLARETAEDRPGDAGMEYVLVEVLARLALGDTTAAERVLEYALSSLPNAGRVLTGEVTSIGALMRLWLLRAELASRRGDAEAAATAARLVATYWQDADPVLASAVTAARGLAGVAAVVAGAESTHRRIP